MDKNINLMSLEELKGVSGGLVVLDNEAQQYWLVREDGSVISPVPSEAHGVEFAKAYGVSTRVITKEEYRNRFGRELKW